MVIYLSNANPHGKIVCLYDFGLITACIALVTWSRRAFNDQVTDHSVW